MVLIDGLPRDRQDRPKRPVPGAPPLPPDVDPTNPTQGQLGDVPMFDSGGAPQGPRNTPPPTGDVAPAGVEEQLPLPPMPPRPPNTNTPLALPGTFSTPGTRGAVPFRTPTFLQNRVVGPTGPGTNIFGGLPGQFGKEEGDPDEEYIRNIVSGFRGRLQ